jgi:hypothetical protein
MTQSVRAFSSSCALAWDYDPLYRLTNQTITGTAPAGTVSYLYDAVGNQPTAPAPLAALATRPSHTLSTTA